MLPFRTILVLTIRFMVNSFSITSFEVGSCGAEKEVVGYSLYLAPCILDHSCAPNAKVREDILHTTHHAYHKTQLLRLKIVDKIALQ